MIKNYFKIALRGFWRHKIFTLINILGLSIGVSAALVIYLIVHFDLTFDKFHKDNDSIYRVVTDFKYAGDPVFNGGVTDPLPDAVATEATGLQVSAPFYQQDEYNVNIPGKTPTKFKHEKGMVYAGKQYFDIFTYNWLVGSPKNSLNGPYQVVLTETKAKKYFPNLRLSDVLGKQVVYDDTIRTTVTGIVADFKENSDLTFSDFISFVTEKNIKNIYSQQTNWTNTNGSSQFYVKLLPGTKPANIEKQINQIFKKHVPPVSGKVIFTQTYHLQPLNDLHFNKNYSVYDNSIVSKSTLYGLMAIAGFLLILGCINFVNLTTAQASQRAKEIGIRKTMGSTRKQLIFQHLGETFLITLFAIMIATLLAPFILKIFADFIPPGVKADYFGHPGIFLFLTALAILVSFLAGFYPALVLSGYKPVLVLKNQAYSNTGKTRNSWMRKSLTITQFIIAQFFIMGTILVSKQIYFALHTDLGFKKDAIVYFYTPWTDWKNKEHKRIILNRIKELPQVEMVSEGNDVPSTNGWSSHTQLYMDGKKQISTNVQVKNGDENYSKVYHIKLLAGRYVAMSDTNKAVMINSTYAKILEFRDPQKAIGKFVDAGKQKREIVGVFADFHQGSLHAPIKPLEIQTQSNGGTFHIALKPQTAGGNEWKTAIAAMQKSYKKIYPDDNFDYHFFDESIAKLYTTEQHTAILLKWATGLSLFISSLGLLGLAIYTTNQRRKEIGVRKVLGVSVSQIVTLLSTELAWLIVIAFIIVTPVALYIMVKWMGNFADHTPISWWIFIVAGAGMLVTALITSSFQTVKAAIANPVESLKSE